MQNLSQLAAVGLVQHGFCVRRGAVQTWSFMLLFKFSASIKFCAPKPARTQSPRLASIKEEKSFENLKFQQQTQQETEKIKDRRSELKDEDE
jgi:hypothetical protein